MKKYILLITIAAAPFMSNAQEIGLTENYKTKKEKRLAKYKPIQSGDLIINAGMSNIRYGYGLSYNIGAEYMLTKKLGIRSFYSTSRLSNSTFYYGGHSRASIDLTYHFVQTKRWDVYAFLGVGAERFRYGRWYNGTMRESFAFNRPALNAGVGARYKITPSFGVQAEIGKVSSFGLFKKFSLGRR